MPRVQNPGLGSGQVPLLSTITTLTAAQVIAMSGAPVTVVAAPGAGLLLIPIGAVVVYRFGTRAFLPLEQFGIAIGYSGTSAGNYQLGAYAGIVNKTQDASAWLANFQQQPNLLLPGVNNTALVVTSDTAYTQGPISSSTLGAGGLGYVANDTGTITTGSADATYKVLTVGAGGAVLTYQITGAGTQYATANGVATATGGAQPGVGTGLTVNITAVSTGDGTLKVVTYYQIIPVP